MTDRMPQKVRPFALLAPGAVLVAAFYWLDYPTTESGVYPIHSWSTAGVIFGWWVLLIALALVGRTGFIGLLALFSALALGTAWMAWIGVIGASLVFLLATSTEIVNGYGWRGRVKWAIGLGAFGAGILALNGVNSSIPVVESPAGAFLATLVAAPVFIGVRWAWRWRFGPPGKRWLAGSPLWNSVLLITFIWSVNVAIQPLRKFGAPYILAYGGAVVAVLLVGAGAMVLAPMLRSWARLWLAQTGTATAADPNLLSGSFNDSHAWDGTQYVPSRPPSPPALSSQQSQRSGLTKAARFEARPSSMFTTIAGVGLVGTVAFAFSGPFAPMSYLFAAFGAVSATWRLFARLVADEHIAGVRFLRWGRICQRSEIAGYQITGLRLGSFGDAVGYKFVRRDGGAAFSVSVDYWTSQRAQELIAFLQVPFITNDR